MIRQPVVAGQFYPSSAIQLKKMIEGFIDKKAQKQEALGAVVPHAGYIYSGKVAASLLCRIGFKETFIILGPNHTGYGRPFSVMAEGTWRTPLGDVQIDKHLAKTILESSAYLEEDSLAHRHEHSIEVQLPFLQYLKEDIKIVPIVISHSDIITYKNIGENLAEAIKKSERKVILLASSDMTHYEPQSSAENKDKKAIEAILNLDEDRLLKNVEELNISMCGYAPTIIMLTCCKQQGAKRGKLILYQTSGDTSGDYFSVVGYAGIIIS